MAISNKLIQNASPTQIFSASTGTECAITTIVFCNTSPTIDSLLDVWVVSYGNVPGAPLTQVLKTVSIPAAETFVMDTEKFILSDGDSIYAQVTPPPADELVSSVVSYVIIS
jgi:hypothetical protein